MQTYGYHDNKDKITARLKRAEGQVRGISRMVDSDTYCIDILTQISATQAALDKVALELLRTHTKHCLSNAETAAERHEKTEELVTAVGRLLGR
jgi:CsoR family transcriptional regulator, copper-sensing transcriptional repressor